MSDPQIPAEKVKRAAHDLNNLLAIIKGNAELGLERFQAGEPVGEELEQVLQAGERAAELTRQLLAAAEKSA